MAASDFVSTDGSPLAMYLALPAGEAPMIVDAAIPSGSTILELGSGPGRLTRVLVALGHTVTAVDDSEEMLEHVTGAETVRGDVFDLNLDQQFDVVLAASHLINVPGHAERTNLLRTCRRHLYPAGHVVIERHAPGWLFDCKEGTSIADPVSMTFVPGNLEDDVRSATMIYSLAGRSWRQEFRTEDVDNAKLAAAAAETGLNIGRTLTHDQRWLTLVADDGSEV